MEVGMVGLGRMGGNMAHRLALAGNRVVVFDIRPEAVSIATNNGAVGASSLEELVSQLSLPRTVWVMLPSGTATGNVIKSLADILCSGDTIIEGGNSNYKDSMRRSKNLEKRGIFFLDAGISGGIWGLEEGYSVMVGGDVSAYLRASPIFRALAPSPHTGFSHVGPSGAGHYVKMIHNGIEYGLMQAYAEGFELLRAKTEFQLDLPQISEVWRYGSVVRSWLLDLITAALRENPGLENVKAYVEDSGEGRWAVQASIELGVPAPIMALALQTRFRSRQDQPFSGRLLAAMRNQFGGHSIGKQHQ